MKPRNAASLYEDVNVHAEVLQASPHRLIQILMEEAYDKLLKAKGFMSEKNVAEKGAHISFAITIIDGLKAALDEEKGGEIATNLSDLYDYMMEKLVESNLNNDINLLDQVIKLLMTIKDGWDQIPEEHHHG